MAVPYVLGVDGLPLGRMVAVATGGAVEGTFAVPLADGPALGLLARVEAAVAEADRLRGARAAEVRLVCVDDGADGSEAAAVGEWLADRHIAFRLLDLVGPDGPAPDPTAAAGPSEMRADTRSEGRARDAALF